MQIWNNWKLLKQKGAKQKQAKQRERDAKKNSISQTTERKRWVRDWERNSVRVGSVCCCGLTCFLSVTIIALCVPPCEKRGRGSSDTWDAQHCHYMGNSNIPFNALPHTITYIVDTLARSSDTIWLMNFSVGVFRSPRMLCWYFYKHIISQKKVKWRTVHEP